MTEVNQAQTEDQNIDNQLWDFLNIEIKSNVLRVLFEKADGTMREMWCTLNPDLIDYQFKNLGGDDPTIKQQTSEDTLTVWDTENQGWRKLKKGKIHTVDVLDDEFEYEGE